jgi:hypothetical protein
MAMTVEMEGKRNGRKNPFARAGSISQLVLQPRDVAILKFIYEYGLLSGKQIQQLLRFGCATRRNARLRPLFDHGYVDRFFLPTLNGNAKILYVLGPKGALVIAETLGLDVQVVKRRIRQMRETKEMFLLHRLQANQTRLTLSSAMDQSSGMRMDLWRGEPELPEVRLIPDGYCQYRYRDQLWSFFLELDRSTESHRRIQAKVEAYLRFGLSGLYQRHFGLKFFRVLLVALNEKRLLNLKRLIEKTTDKIFWFATLEEITPETVLFSPIWRRPGKDGLFALHEEIDALLSEL